MKKLKFITIGIIITNILLLAQDIPLNVILLAIGSLILSLFIKQKTARVATKIVILFSSMVMLRLAFKNLVVTECAVSFVLMLSAIKFWELDEDRDHFNMFLILALCECSIFLLNPTFLIFVMGMTKMLFYFYYILKIRNYDISLLNTRRLLLLVTPSLILSLVLFYTFPRFTQGFLNPTDMQYIISGGSSRLDFQQLGPLSGSTEQAFKVYGLEKSGLPVKVLYWKSNVLWHLKNNEWTPGNQNLRQENPVVKNPGLRYEVELFSNYKEYMPTLVGTSSVALSSLPFNAYSDGSFKIKTMSRSPLTYTVIGNYGERAQTIDAISAKKGLKIKSENLLKLRQMYDLGKDDFPNDQEKLKALIQVFKKQVFEYSVSPPMYSSVEEFLLKGKKGYCSHFAAAFTYLARIHNLPARIVSGYLGGEFNPYDNSIIVRELDAHAWVEVFVRDRGWTQVDPTVFVAPERITMSAQEFNNKLDPYITIFNLQISRNFLNTQSVNNLSLWLDSLNSKFNNNIFNFDREKQLAVLRSLTPGKMAIGWIFSLSLALFLVIFWFIFHFYGKKRLNPAEKRYLRFIKKMQSFGCYKEISETVTHFKKRCQSEVPEQTSYIDQEVAYYIDSFYK